MCPLQILTSGRGHVWLLGQGKKGQGELLVPRPRMQGSRSLRGSLGRPTSRIFLTRKSFPRPQSNPTSWAGSLSRFIAVKPPSGGRVTRYSEASASPLAPVPGAVDYLNVAGLTCDPPWSARRTAAEGYPKTHGGTPVSTEGVCGWLADGYHYPKTFGGQPKLVTASGRDGWLVSSS